MRKAWKSLCKNIRNSDSILRSKCSVKYIATHSENPPHACRSSLPSRRECRLSIYGRVDLIITDYLFALLQPITEKRRVRMSITSFLPRIIGHAVIGISTCDFASCWEYRPGCVRSIGISCIFSRFANTERKAGKAGRTSSRVAN